VFVLIGSISTGQNIPYSPDPPPQIWSASELINIWETKGFYKDRNRVSPLDLIYLDSSYAKKIIQLEFESDFCIEPFANSGIYLYKVPEFTMKIAKKYEDKYAVNKLFQYYKNIPKFIKSDTIYSIYNDLDEFLSILVYYNPKGLKDRLKSDYSKWRSLAKIAPDKYYPTRDYMFKLLRGGIKNVEIKEIELLVDCDFVLFQIASALRKLNSPGFDKDLIDDLARELTYYHPFDLYTFPHMRNPMDYTVNTPEQIIRLDRSYPDIYALVSDYEYFEKRIFSRENASQYENINTVIHDYKNTAYISISSETSSNSYKVKLLEDRIIIQWIKGILVQPTL